MAESANTFRASKMSGVLALDFTGAEEAARSLVMELVAPDKAQVLLPTALLADVLKQKRIPRRTHLIVVGAPPKDSIGYGLVPLLAVALRARTVTLLDARSRAVRSSSLKRYVATTAPFALGQLLGSGLALSAQRILASARLLGAISDRPPGRALHRMLYLFPSVGTPTSIGVGGGVSHAHGMLQALHDLGIAVDPFTSEPAMAETAAAQPDFPYRWNVVRSPGATKALPASAAFGLDAALAAATRVLRPPAATSCINGTRFSLAGALTARVAKLPFFLEFNSPAEFFHPRATLLAGQRRRCEDASLLAATRVFVVSTAAKRLLVNVVCPRIVWL